MSGNKPIDTSLPPFVPTTEYKYTTSPNPGWTYGQRIDTTPTGQAWAKGESDGWTVVDTESEDPNKLYHILITAIVPRPIALVSTISEEGIENLAPISWFNEVSPYPAVISISIAHRSQAAKDTLQNILNTKEFTANIVSEAWIEQAHAASIYAPPEVGEWPITGLTKAPCLRVKPKRVQESACSMECELLQTVEIKDPRTGLVNHTLVLGTVRYIHIRNDVIDPERGTVDPGKLKPVARMGGGGYAKVNEGYRIAPPVYNEAAQEVVKLQ